MNDPEPIKILEPVFNLHSRIFDWKPGQLIPVRLEEGFTEGRIWYEPIEDEL